MFALVNPGPKGIITDLWDEDPKIAAPLVVVEVPSGTKKDWFWDGVKAAPPAPIPAAIAGLLFTPREFMALFTAAEQTAIFTARRTSVQVDQFITLAMAGNVDLTNAEVIADIGALEQAGLIMADRAKQILAGTAAPSA